MRPLSTPSAWLVLTAVIMTALLATPAVAQETAARTPLNANLVLNPSAEAKTAITPDGWVVVKIPAWKSAGKFTLCPYGASSAPTPEESRRIGGGKYFFAGGPDNARSSAYQVIAITGHGPKIAQGKLKLLVSAWLAGWDGQGDSARVIVEFHGANDRLIKSMRTAAVSATDNIFKKKSASAIVPPGTTHVKVILLAIRSAGAYNDGYFDRIDLRLLNVR